MPSRIGNPSHPTGGGFHVSSHTSAFRYVSDGGRLGAGLKHVAKIVLMTDDDHKGHIRREELATRLRPHALLVRRQPATKSVVGGSYPCEQPPEW